ncbi:hypothetical protein BGZ49_003684 [Haplosporangium sp. Z 27]|nr:hypothetical protein BGZ49_003684 [Haplosporangium sp. Z 27]
MSARVATSPSSADKVRSARTKQQQSSLLQQHQPFPSSTSSYSIRNSTSTNSLLGPNDSTRIPFQEGTSEASYSSSGTSNLNFPGQYFQTQSPSSLDHRRTSLNYGLIDAATSSTYYSPSYGAGTQSGVTNNGTARAGRGSLARSLLLSSQQDLDANSLYTIDNTTPVTGGIVDSDNESTSDDGVSYFGSAGQDYLLKQKRAQRSKMICWLDLIILILFTALAALKAPKSSGDGQTPKEGWTWEWDMIPRLLTVTAVLRILLLSFTARYNDGNYNAAVIFGCMLITLSIMFEVNMVIQHRIALTAAIIAQYFISLIITQLHWINYSVHTPMSASLAYAYDPVLSEGITFTRESRYMGSSSYNRTSTLRRGTSYGTMNNSPFDAVQEMDEETDDQDTFIKVNVEHRSLSTRRRSFYRHDAGIQDEEDDDISDDGSDTGNNRDQEYADEEQDMATLLAFQDARRRQVYAFSPTASSSIIPTRSILSPQALPSDSSNIHTPISWALQGQQSGIYSPSYDRRMAAAGLSGATAISGGLTVGYAPRKRSLRSNIDPNGTGRRTWTSGRNIIYSGIFVEDSDEDDLDPDQGAGEDSTPIQDDVEDDEKHQEQTDFDDTIKAEIIDSVMDNNLSDQSQHVAIDKDQTPSGATSMNGIDLQQTHLDDLDNLEDMSEREQHRHLKESKVDGDKENTVVDTPGEESKMVGVLGGDRQHHPHGLSTLKLHISSHKDVTAVMCDEDNCSEHQFQENPSAELEAAVGLGLASVNILKLDIKENSTLAVERSGASVDGSEGYSLPSTIRSPLGRLLDDPNIENENNVGALEPISNGKGREHEWGIRKVDHGLAEHHRGRIDTGMALETNDLGCGNNSAIGALDLGGFGSGEKDGEHGVHRRINIHERIERVTIDEIDEGVNGIDIRSTARPSQVTTVGGVTGEMIGVYDPSKVNTTISTSVITWGIADDINPYIQDGVYLQPESEPLVYIPPQQTAILDPPQPSVITIPPQSDPVVVIEPQPVVLRPEPQPVILQPQLEPPVIIRRPLEPIIYSPPRRPVIVPPQVHPPPLPVVQPIPLAVAPPPPTHTIIQPQLQLQPQIVAPAAPAVLAPQSQVIAPAPLIQPEYGTYETIVPGVQMGVSEMQSGVGVGTMPLNRRYSVASIHDDHSIASVYDGDARSVASIYDDQTVASINEYETTLGVLPASGVDTRQAWMRGQPLPGTSYRRRNHLVSAAHVPRTHEAYIPQQTQPCGGEVDMDTSMDQKSESDIHALNSHINFGFRRSGLPRHPQEPFGGQSEFGDHADNSTYSTHTENDMEVENTLALAAARHKAAPSDSVSTEISYQEIELHKDIPAAVTVPLQELAVETYFDTTKSQLKIREQQGQLLSEMALKLKRRQQQMQQQAQQQEEQRKEGQQDEVQQIQAQDQHAQFEQQKSNEQLKTQGRQPQYLPSPPYSNQAISPEPSTSPVSSLSQSIQLQQQIQQQQQPQQQLPPTLNFPKPPLSPPPVRLLVNRGITSPFTQPKDVPILTQPHTQRNRNEHTKKITHDDDGQYAETIILSSSAQNTENIMLQERHPTPSNIEAIATVAMTTQQDSSLSSKTRSFFSTGNLKSVGVEQSAVQQTASGKPPLPANTDLRPKVGYTTTTAAANARKPRRKQHIPPMSRHHLHPALLQDGIMACWNNEFGNALEIFKENSTTYPRWSLASAEVHIVRQLISGQFSEADSELMDALQLSEKVGSRVMDKKQEFDASFMSYRSLCSSDATLLTVNDNTLRQNYKWDCDMSFYDTLLYRSLLQLTAASDTKTIFSLSDLRGGLQLRRAWKGYMRIKQEVEAAKERWQKLSALVAQSQSTATAQPEVDPKSKTSNDDEEKENRSSRFSKATTMPISIPSAIANPIDASHSAGWRKDTSISTSQPSEGSSRWSIFGKRSSWNHQSAASLSTSPVVDGFLESHTMEQTTGSKFIASSPSSKGLANIIREQVKAIEEIKTAVKVLEDIEDYLYYGIGLFYFIVSVVPKSMLPALRAIGLQSNPDQGIKSLEDVFMRKNGREFGKAADIFEILWKRYITTSPNGVSATGVNVGRKRKGRSSSIGQPIKNEALAGTGSSSNQGSSFSPEDEEEDDFELAPFCGLCLIASKVVVRLGQEGYFEYGREGFGHHNSNDNSGPLSPISGLLLEGYPGSRPLFNLSGSSETPWSTSPRPGPDFDLLIAAQEVLIMMSDPELQMAATMASKSGGSIFEHSKTGSTQSTDASEGKSTVTSQLLSTPPPTQSGKLNRFNKFAWNQCQKSLQLGRISPFLPLVILYLRRDLAYMKPVLLRKYRTTLETIWKSVQKTADADTQAIYLLLSAVVHRQLLPDDVTFTYTALTDCLLLESTIENEMWVVPHCHYELGELLYKRLHLPQAALEQFLWIVKGPGKEIRPASIFQASVPSSSNPRHSVFGGGFPSDTITNIVESVAAQCAAEGEGGGHSNHPSTSSDHRLSQLFLSTSATGGVSVILGSSPTHIPPLVTNPPNPTTFYNSRYKKFEFSQALRHRSSISIDQIQKEIDRGTNGGGSGSNAASRRASISSTVSRKKDASIDNQIEQQAINDINHSQKDGSRKRYSAQSTESTNQGTDGSTKSIKLSNDRVAGEESSMLNAQTTQSTRLSNETASQAVSSHGLSSNTMPNILSDAQRKRGSQQYGLGRLRPSQSSGGKP